MDWVLVQGTVIDGTGAPPRHKTTLLIEQGRISALQGADAAAPPGARLLDCRGKFVLPGLIDSHVHLAFCAGPDHPTTVRQVMTDSEQTLVLREARNAQACLRAGITTVRDCGGRGWGTLALRDAIAGGLVTGPGVLASGMPLTPTFGHLYFCGLEAEGVEGMRVAARTLAKQGVDFFKVMVTGGIMTGNARPRCPQYSQPELDALCEEARRLDKHVAAHVGSTEGIRRAVRAGVHTIEHCAWAAQDGSVEYDPRLAEEMAARGIWGGMTVAGISRNILLPGATSDEAERQRRLDAFYQEWQPLREMARAGVPLMLSSDAGVRITPFDDIASSMRFYSMMMEASPLQTIQAITQAPAQALGLAQEVGAIEVGKRADLLILDADPLADLENMRQVSSVIVDGRLAVTGGALLDHPGGQH